ncbi:MAG TPA: metallopeptidase family protein [Thermoflexales bacterium]|nr:metallopeptidase family protein [Thermoflexales bacterium]HQW36731.1 metallopeptidase family protein [Thermoflexales bacterium]HQZ21682.1 metallopeptidase family protein [Thermoflexales bacterium]
MRISRREFEELVWAAMDALPEAITQRVQNVEVLVKYAPAQGQLEGDEEDLFGFYEGIPLTERTTHYEMVAPDVITIFQRAHEAHCATLACLREEVSRTLRHELAHYFGIDDDRLEELGAY